MTTVALAYHGSLRRFDRFATQPPMRATVAPTAHLGTFCVENPRIAAHFTLRPHVISAGYRHELGSRILSDDPWQLDDDPFLPGAAVATVAVNLTNPRHLSINEWITLMGGFQRAPHLVTVWREHCQERGHDGVRVEAWNQQALLMGRSRPSVETDAVTWIAFAPESLNIRHWADVTSLWSP